jgi:hypothetical protein
LKTVSINHKDDRGHVHYPLYEEEEATQEGITYTHWQDAEQGGWAVSDDGLVSQLIDKRYYQGKSEGSGRWYYRFPWGRFFVKGNTKHQKALARNRKYTLMRDGCLRLQEQNPDKPKTKEQNFVTAYSVTMDADLATEVVSPQPSRMEIHRNRRFAKTETFRRMLRSELVSVLEIAGVTEGDVIELLQEAIEMARQKKDITNLLRVAENFQRMLGINEPDKVKTTNVIEASRTKRLIDKVSEEEEKLKLTQVIGDHDVEEPPKEGNPAAVGGAEVEIVQEEEAQL